MSLEKEFEKLIGANDAPATVKHWLDTGFPPLNKALSGDYFGGMPSGRIIEIYGAESSGKTAIATCIMAAAQREGGVAIFMDHEHSFDFDHAKSLGLDLDPNKFVYKKPETFEKSISMVLKLVMVIREKKLIDEDAPIVAIFDSLASMVPMSKSLKEVDEYNMNDNTALARATSALMPTLSDVSDRMDLTSIFLNQMRQKIGVMFGDNTTTPGGNSVKYYYSLRLAISRTKVMQEEKGKKGKQFVGQVINANVVKNKVSRPFEKANWRFMFRDDGSGYFDVAMSMIEHLEELGALDKSGNYIVWTDGKKYYPKQLAKKLNEEGTVDELKAFLPS